MEKPPKKKTRVDSPESSSDEKAVNNTTQQDQVPEKEQEFADALTELNHVSDGDEVPNSLPKATSAQPEETPSAQQEETQDAQLEERASDNMNQDAQVENGAQAKLNDTQKSAQQTLKEQREPRLVMKKMVLNNFKSYAGRQVIGPFHKSFSAIVGPNGSGKSNVIDALLFVFGYKANKMRQGKLAELIHNSSKHPNCTECSVEIHFQEIVDGADSFTIVPNSNLVVSRSANRSSTSRYYINGRGSSFTQVTTMLKGKGIDLDHKRFLILQGEVESIALMKAKGKDGSEDGLLEYLEDIIGTSKYKEPIEEANSKLEVLNEDRAEKLSRVKYVARERDSLEDKKIEAENYLESENLLARKKNELYQIYHFEAGQNIKTAKEAIVELDAQLKEEEEKYQSIENEKKEMSETHSAAVKQFNALEATTAKTVKQQAKIEKDLVQHRERKEHVATQFEKRRQTLEDDRAARLKAQQGIKTHTETLEKDKKSSVTLEKQLKREEKQLDEISAELQGKTNEFTRQIEEHKQRLAPWTEKINEKTKAIDLKRSESDLLEETIESGQRAVKDAKQKLGIIEQTTAEKRKAMQNLPNEIKELKVELKDLEAEFVSLTDKEAEKRTELNGVRQKADEARASLQQAQSRGKVLDSIIRMRDSGRIDGIYDRLGNLGVIDDKYDVAISTACPALDNIVVETVEAAQACIEHLRKNNIGRAVFTVLSKLSFRPNDMRSIDTPDSVPRLFDLIKPKNERFAPAFYSVLRDTIVARDMSQANRIAYGKNRWRVVTLDGKLIERSGAMSGGGSGPLRGAMGSKFKGDGASPETVAKLEQERDHLEVEYRNVVEEKRAIDLGLRKKKETLPRKELALEKLQMDLNSLEEQLQDETKRLEQLKEKTQPKPEDVERKQQIVKEIETLEQEKIKLDEQSAEIQEAINEIQEEIMNAGGMDLRLQRICVEDVRKKIDTLNNRTTKTMVAKAKAEKDVVKYETSIVKFEKESKQFEEDLKSIEAKVASTTEKIEDINQQVEKAKEAVDEKKKEMEELKSQLDEKTNEINKLRESELSVKNSREDYQRLLVDNEKKAAHWQDQISKLNLVPINPELEEDLTLETLDDKALAEATNLKSNIKTDIAELEATVLNAKPNLSVLDEYRRREKEYNEKKADLDQITQKRDDAKGSVEGLRKKRLDEFMHGFNIISQKLKEMYQMITMGGNAELELVDSLDPFSEGIVFSVMPPKKSWKNISNLSGGEKTLSSLALVFALHHFKPTPLYVMDEIDAALDFRNVSIVANYIAERTKNAQFVIISLRNNMFELADRLVGIYKTSDCTKSIAINPNMIALLTETPTHTESQPVKQTHSTQQSQQKPLATQEDS